MSGWSRDDVLPGAVLVDGEVAGTWRPTTKAGRLALAVSRWRPFDTARGLGSGGVTVA